VRVLLDDVPVVCEVRRQRVRRAGDGRGALSAMRFEFHAVSKVQTREDER
jgi:hypothetical protein